MAGLAGLIKNNMNQQDRGQSPQKGGQKKRGGPENNKNVGNKSSSLRKNKRQKEPKTSRSALSSVSSEGQTRGERGRNRSPKKKERKESVEESPRGNSLVRNYLTKSKERQACEDKATNEGNEGRSLSKQENTLSFLNEVANSIDEMISFTYDVTTFNDDQKIPMLDLKVSLD